MKENEENKEVLKLMSEEMKRLLGTLKDIDPKAATARDDIPASEKLRNTALTVESLSSSYNRLKNA